MFDLSMSRRHSRQCDGASRRDFLRVGALGGLALGLPDLLRAQAAAAELGSARARAKSVVLVFLGGGMSHHDTFDPKPEAISEIRGKYSTIETNVAGVQVTELLPRMAMTMDKVALVRSQAHTNDHHETATNWVLSGRFGSAFGDHPAIGAVAAHEIGFSGKLPPYVAVPQNPSFTWELGKSAYLGARYESFKAGDPNQEGYRVRDLTSPVAALEERQRRRQSLLEQVDGLARRIDGNDQLDSYDEFQQRATEMVLSSEARDAFAIEKEDPQARERYGRTTFGQSCLLARRLVEGGVRFVTINSGGWDHHAKIWQGLETRVPELDQGLSAMLEDMEQRGLLEDTFVVVMGEFGRSPKVNKDIGRDHWAGAGSMLFAGAGVRPGRVIGKTDKEGGSVTEHPYSPADVAYTMLSSLGINPRKQLHTPDGRPMEILDEGELMQELYS